MQVDAMTAEGFTRFARDLARAAVGLEEAADKASERVARQALKTARDIVPVDEGDLRSGLRYRRDGDKAIVEVTAFYATFQEFGTSRMAPNPFIGPAFDRHAPELVREVEEIRDDVVKELS